MSGRRYLQLGPVSIYRSHRDLVIRAGRWQCHFCWPWSPGRFGNESRWRSGWHEWADQPDPPEPAHR